MEALCRPPASWQGRDFGLHHSIPLAGRLAGWHGWARWHAGWTFTAGLTAGFTGAGKVCVGSQCPPDHPLPCAVKCGQPRPANRVYSTLHVTAVVVWTERWTLRETSGKKTGTWRSTWLNTSSNELPCFQKVYQASGLSAWCDFCHIACCTPHTAYHVPPTSLEVLLSLACPSTSLAGLLTPTNIPTEDRCPPFATPTTLIFPLNFPFASLVLQGKLPCLADGTASRLLRRTTPRILERTSWVGVSSAPPPPRGLFNGSRSPLTMPAVQIHPSQTTTSPTPSLLPAVPLLLPFPSFGSRRSTMSPRTAKSLGRRRTR